MPTYRRAIQKTIQIFGKVQQINLRSLHWSIDKFSYNGILMHFSSKNAEQHQQSDTMSVCFHEHIKNHDQYNFFFCNFKDELLHKITAGCQNKL